MFRSQHHVRSSEHGVRPGGEHFDVSPGRREPDRTLNRVERACAELHHNGQPITFTAVAARTGLGRTTLYRNPTLRAVIDQHRHRSTTGGTLTGLTDEIATLRTALDALATRVRRHEEQLRRLQSRKG